MAPRILIVSQTWEPHSSVVSRRWEWLGRELVRSGMDVCILSDFEGRVDFRRMDDQGNLEGVSELASAARVPRRDVLRNTVWGKALEQIRVSIRQLFLVLKPGSPVRKFAPNLVIGTVPALSIAPATRRIARILGIPYLIDLRDAWPELLAERPRWNESVGDNWFDRVLLRGPLEIVSRMVEAQLRLVFREAAAVTATTDGIADGVSRYRKSDKMRAVVILNLFGPRVQRIANSSVSERCSKVPLRVLYAGTIGRAQGLENLIAALRKAKDQGTKISLRIAGDGAGIRQLSQMARELEIDIEYLGRLAPSELQVHYQWADTALVHLADWKSLYTTVPSKMFELLELGIHVTAVVEGEAASIMRELGAGIVVSPGDPNLLADAFISLERDRGLLHVDERASHWVSEQRAISERTLIDTVSKVCTGLNILIEGNVPPEKKA